MTATVTMPLSKALYILASTHTHDDGQTGFVVIAGVGPYSPFCQWPPSEYMRAWEAVRAACHMQVKPEGKP